jgi:hypothetical protein
METLSSLSFNVKYPTLGLRLTYVEHLERRLHIL